MIDSWTFLSSYAINNTIRQEAMATTNAIATSDQNTTSDIISLGDSF
jgi:hypothetical protein